MQGSLIQRSFSGGEIAPALYARADQAKYQTGLRTCLNFFVRRHGGASNWPGSQFICPVKDSTLKHKIKKFVFNADQTYILLFGDFNLRIVRQGVLLTVSNLAAWDGSVAYVMGDLVTFTGANFYCIQDHTNQSTSNPDYWYPMPADGTYELPTPYAVADLFELQTVQSGDVVSIDHVSYDPMELRRTDHTAWTLILATIGSQQNSPVGAYTKRGTTGSTVYRYRVTGLGDASGQESLPARGPLRKITGITQANPCVVTSAGHGFVDGDEIFITDVMGMTQINDSAYIVTNSATNTFELDGIDSTTFAAYKSGGFVSRTFLTLGTTSGSTAISTVSLANPCVVTTSGAHGLATGQVVVLASIKGTAQLNQGAYCITVLDGTHFELNGIDARDLTAYVSGGTVAVFTEVTGGVPVTATPHIITWSRATNSVTQRYSVYKEQDGVYGYIGSATGNLFHDTGITPDFTLGPPQSRNPFNALNNRPRVPGYYQQRRLHGGSNLKPETVWTSKTGQFTDFSISTPLKDDDAMTFTVAGKQVNEIRHFVDLGTLVILTSGGEWIALGDGNNAMSAKNGPGLKQFGYSGSSTIPPLISGSNMLYIQARGNRVRDFRTVTNMQGQQGFSGDDLTVFASHLFENRTIVYWDYAELPNNMAVAVCNDGTIVTLTYLKEQEVQAWSRRDTDGVYEDVCVVPEFQEDAIYVLVRRTVNGQTVRYLERFASRKIVDVRADAKFLDCHLSYDGRNTLNITMTVSGGTSRNVDETLMLTASGVVFGVGDVGNVIHLGYSQDLVRLQIAAVLSDQTATVRPDRIVPTSIQNVATTDWAKAVDQVAGLDHLEGKAVSILADGDVITNGIDNPLTTIVGGQLSTPLIRAASLIHVGLPYMADLETLDLEVVDGSTLADKQKRVGSVTVYTENSRGGFVGQALDDFMVEIPPTIENYRVPIQPVTGKTDPIAIRSAFNTGGRVAVRQKDPLPMTVLAIIPNVEMEG